MITSLDGRLATNSSSNLITPLLFKNKQTNSKWNVFGIDLIHPKNVNRIVKSSSPTPSRPFRSSSMLYPHFRVSIFQPKQAMLNVLTSYSPSLLMLMIPITSIQKSPMPFINSGRVMGSNKPLDLVIFTSSMTQHPSSSLTTLLPLSNNQQTLSSPSIVFALPVTLTTSYESVNQIIPQQNKTSFAHGSSLPGSPRVRFMWVNWFGRSLTWVDSVRNGRNGNSSTVSWPGSSLLVTIWADPMLRWWSGFTVLRTWMSWSSLWQ